MNSFGKLEGHRRPPLTRATHLGTSKPELERDSGFSDASSEYMSAVDLTDSEDAGRTVSIIGQDQISPQLTMIGGSYPGLSPMIIMNNFVLKQPNPMTPADKQWSFPSPLEMMPQSQVVLLQPVVSNGNSSSPKTENHRQSRNYLPILKSYPRIAPHPGDAPSKRQPSSRVRSNSTSGYEQRQRRHHHGHRLYSSPSAQAALQTPVKPVSSFEAASSQAQAADCQEPCLLQLNDKPHSLGTETSSLPSCPHELRLMLDSNMHYDDKYQDALSMDDNKQKRFSNTYNILNKSGLLGITLRTKQLIKENRHTQNQLQQLQEQTTLLMEALSSGDPQLWTKLQLALQDTDKEQWGIKSPSVLA